MNTLVVVGPDGQIVCERCELADGPVSRMRGLIGRSRLPRGRGMLVRPRWFVHTAFMRFPIDVIFLDRDLKVLATRDHLLPWRVAAHPRAHSVLKLAAGETEALGIRAGDKLAWGSLPREGANSRNFTVR
jgi:uncharacterized membrane protein (UPF0127 family)